MLQVIKSCNFFLRPSWRTIKPKQKRSLQFSSENIQYRYHADPDPGFRPKMGKNYSRKKINVLLIKNCSLPVLIPRPPKRTSKLHAKPSALKREHAVLKNLFFKLFLFLWVIFAFLNPDPHSQGGTGSSRPKSMRIRIRNNVWHTAYVGTFGKK